jgi:hypothetical protein
MQRKPKPSKASKASKAGKKSAATSRYETEIEPYAHFNWKMNALSVTAHPAFLREGSEYVRSEDGSYIGRYAHPDRIIPALQKLTAPTIEGTDIWPLVQANDPEALRKVSRAIQSTYNEEGEPNLPEQLDSYEVRGSRALIICTRHQVPRTVPYPDAGLYKRIVSPPPLSNSARSGVLPSARIVARPHKTKDKSKIASVSIVFDGTFATKNGEIKAMTTKTVDELAKIFTGAVPLIWSELASLASSNPGMGSNYKQRHGKTKEQLEEMADALANQWCESVLGPQEIDHERVEGSVSTYAANPVHTGVIRDLQPIRVDVVADYSRITGRGSVDEVEEDAGR